MLEVTIYAGDNLHLSFPYHAKQCVKGKVLLSTIPILLSIYFGKITKIPAEPETE